MADKKSKRPTLKGVGTLSSPPEGPLASVTPSGENPALSAEGSKSGGQVKLAKGRVVTLSALVSQKEGDFNRKVPTISVKRKATQPIVSAPQKDKTPQPLSHDAWTVDRLLNGDAHLPQPDESVNRREVRSESRQAAVASRAKRTTLVSLHPQTGKALDLVEQTSQSGIPPVPVSEMEELFALGNFSEALRVAELVLGRLPEHEQAQRCAQKSRERLEQFYCSKIGSLTQVPAVALQSSDLRWLGLDHRAGFVLSRIDGRLSLDDLLEICSMPRLEVLKTINELLNCGAITLRTP
jgi:hypothetical protein